MERYVIHEYLKVYILIRDYERYYKQDTCQGTRIYCPSADNSRCVISVTASSSEWMIIKANQADYIDTFNYSCLYDHVNRGGYNYCSRSTILLDAIEINTLGIVVDDYAYQPSPVIVYGEKLTNIGSFVFKCLSDCDRLVTLPFRERNIIIDNAHILCDDCYDVVKKTNADMDLLIKESFSMTCVDGRGCTGDFKISLLDSSTAFVDCTEYGTCFGNFDFIGTNANQVTMRCSGDSNTCQYGRFTFTNIDEINMHCSNAYACDQSKITVTDSAGDVTIHCGADQACRNVTVQAISADTLTLNCNGERSCSYGNIYCPSHQSDACNIDCASSKEYNCYWMNIYSATDYVYEYLNLECGYNPPEGSPGSENCNEWRYGFNNYPCDQSCEYLDVGCIPDTPSPIIRLYNPTSTEVYHDYGLNVTRCEKGLVGKYCCPWERDISLTSVPPTPQPASPASPVSPPAFTPAALIPAITKTRSPTTWYQSNGCLMTSGCLFLSILSLIVSFSLS